MKVLIADDSAFIRREISNILSTNGSIELFEARNGKETVEMVEKHKPEVLLLDLVMPEMNGLEAFERIMQEFPIPTIILSAISPQTMDASIQALLMGAFDYIIKPGGLGASDLPNFRKELLNKVLNVSQLQIKVWREIDLLNRKSFLRQDPVTEAFEFGKYLKELKPIQEQPQINSNLSQTNEGLEISELKDKNLEDYIIKLGDSTSDEKIQKVSYDDVRDEFEAKIEKKGSYEEKILGKSKSDTKFKSVLELDSSPIKDVKLSSNIIVMGASVGGPRAIRNIIKNLPKKLPCPILIVQHLNASFVETFVKTLSRYCEINIKMAINGEFIEPGNIYIAPGEKHMEITVNNKKPCIKTYYGNLVHHCMPSIDVLFYSAVRVYKNLTMGIILTGMGEDGVMGLGAIKKAGGVTLAESQDTSVVFGMPKLANERGFADYVIPNYNIKDYIVNFAKSYS